MDGPHWHVWIIQKAGNAVKATCDVVSYKSVSTAGAAARRLGALLQLETFTRRCSGPAVCPGETVQGLALRRMATAVAADARALRRARRRLEPNWDDPDPVVQALRRRPGLDDTAEGVRH